MRKFNIATIITTMFLPIPPTVHADGNLLLEQCIATEKYLDAKEIDNELDIGICLGLVQGVRNTMQIMGTEGPLKACFPEKGIENGQATRIVTAYLKGNPALLHQNEVTLIIMAYMNAYPCK